MEEQKKKWFHAQTDLNFHNKGKGWLVMELSTVLNNVHEHHRHHKNESVTIFYHEKRRTRQDKQFYIYIKINFSLISDKHVNFHWPKVKFPDLSLKLRNFIFPYVFLACGSKHDQLCDYR